MATIPTPWDPTTSDRLSASAFDAGVRDPLVWLLTGFPRVRAYVNSTVTLVDAAGTDLLIPFTGETYDTDAMHSTSLDPSRLIFTTAGLYEINLQLQFPAATYTRMDIIGRIGSAGNPAAGTEIRRNNFSNRIPQWDFTRYFTAGQYIEFFGAQTSGANRAIVADEYGSYVEIKMIATV